MQEEKVKEEQPKEDMKIEQTKEEAEKDEQTEEKPPAVQETKPKFSLFSSPSSPAVPDNKIESEKSESNLDKIPEKDAKSPNSNLNDQAQPLKNQEPSQDLESLFKKRQ